MSPLQRSKKYLAEQGYLVAIVEKWNQWAKVRQDLFGFLDLLCVHKDLGVTLGVQTTTLAHMKERITKIKDHDNYPILKKTGWKISVHGWRKLKSGWEVKIKEL